MKLPDIKFVFQFIFCSFSQFFYFQFSHFISQGLSRAMRYTG